MFKSVGSNWIVQFLKIASALLLMPYVIRMLGIDQYGNWILIGSITGYLGLFILGAPLTSMRYLAKAIALKDQERLNEFVSSFAGLYVVLGVCCGVTGIGVFFSFPHFFNIPPELLYQTQVALIIAIASTAAGFILHLPYTILFAHHDFVRANLVLGGMIIVRFAATLLLLAWMPTIVTVAAIQIATLFLELAFACLVVRKRYPKIKVGLHRFKLDVLSEIFAFNMYSILFLIGAQFSSQTAAIIIAKFMDIGSISFYSVANSLSLYYIEFLVGIAAVIMPMTTKMQAENSHEGLRRLLLKWSKISLGLTVVGCVFLLFFGPRFLAWWVGNQFEAPGGLVLQILLVSLLIYLPARAVAQPMLNGLGKPGKPAVAYLFSGILTVAMGIALVGYFGLAGVAVGTAVPSILYGIYLVVAVCHETKLAPTTYLRYVYGRIGIACIPMLIVLYYLRFVLDLQGLQGLAIAGFSTTALGICLWFGFVIRNDPAFTSPQNLYRKFISK